MSGSSFLFVLNLRRCMKSRAALTERRAAHGIKIQLGMIKKLIDLGEENPAEEIKERTIQKMKDKTEALIDEALEPTEIQNF